MAEGGEHEAAIAEPPASAVAALRAHEPLWPSHPLEVVETVGIGTEPSVELAHGPRVVHAATGPGHPANLLRLNGDPQRRLCRAGDYAEQAGTGGALPPAAGLGPPNHSALFLLWPAGSSLIGSAIPTEDAAARD